MARTPLIFICKGGTLHSMGRFHNVVAAEYREGELVAMGEIEERSPKSHDHEFAFVGEAWKTLPEALTSEYPTPEHLRKRALIATGWCTVRDYVCTGGAAEARRLARALESELDEYALVVVEANVVRVYRAKSQSKGKMKRAEFQASKDAVLGWISDLIGVTPEALTRARAA